MKDKIIDILQQFAVNIRRDYKADECPNYENCKICDEISDDCDLFFAEGFKLGLKLGFECLQK